MRHGGSAPSTLATWASVGDGIHDRRQGSGFAGRTCLQLHDIGRPRNKSKVGAWSKISCCRGRTWQLHRPDTQSPDTVSVASVRAVSVCRSTAQLLPRCAIPVQHTPHGPAQAQIDHRDSADFEVQVAISGRGLVETERGLVCEKFTLNRSRHRDQGVWCGHEKPNTDLDSRPWPCRRGPTRAAAEGLRGWSTCV